MKHAEVLTSNVFSAFSDVVYAYARQLYRVLIVSPWISIGDRYDPLLRVIDAASQNKRDIIVVTRPASEAWHKNAVDILAASGLSTIYLHPHLHTKLYIVECDGFRAAVLGSPNFTPAGEKRNVELAIILRTTRSPATDDVSRVISDLSRHVTMILGSRKTTLL